MPRKPCSREPSARGPLSGSGAGECEILACAGGVDEHVYHPQRGLMAVCGRHADEIARLAREGQPSRGRA